MNATSTKRIDLPYDDLNFANILVGLIMKFL